MGQTVMSQMQIFNKRLNMNRYKSLGGKKPYYLWFQVFQKMLETEIKYEFWSKFTKNPWEDNMGWTVFTFWRLMKILWKDNMDQTALSFIIFFAIPRF